MDPFLEDDGDDWDDPPAHDGNLWRKLDTAATSRSWVDPAVVTLEIDDGTISKLEGDLVAIHRLLDEHYAGFGNLCEPFMGVVNGTRVATYDLLGYTTRETALALTDACRKTGLESCNLLFDELLAHSLHKPKFAALLLAQAIATTFPETVAFATAMAVQSLVTTESESSLITTMWYLSQAASSSTPISVYAWVQFMLPVSVDTSAPLAARQWALACLQQLATLPVVPGEDTGAQISFDLLIVLDCCCYAEKQVGEILTENYPFLKSVWLAQASDSDLQGLFYRVLMELEPVPQDNSDPRTLELVAIGVGLLSRLDWLYENWRQKVRQRHSKRREFVPLIKGSQHFLQYVLELGYDKKLHKMQLAETLHQMILLCDQFVERSNRLGAALEDAVKVKLALRYFKDLERMLQPSRAGWWVQGAVIVTLVAALIHRLCVHCMACPCGPNRACSDIHPCLLLERTGLAGAIVGVGGYPPCTC